MPQNDKNSLELLLGSVFGNRTPVALYPEGNRSPLLTFRNARWSLIARQSYLTLIPVLAMFSFVMFGDFWLTGTVAFLIAVSPLLLFIAFISSFDRFSFDDGSKVIRKTIIIGIPYDQVKVVEIVEAGNLSTIRVSRGFLQTVGILQALPPEEKDRLIAEMKMRFPAQAVRVRKVPVWKSSAIGCAVMLVFYLLFSSLILTKVPSASVYPVKMTVAAFPAQKETLREYEVSGLRLSLPETFTLIDPNMGVFSDAVDSGDAHGDLAQPRVGRAGRRRLNLPVRQPLIVIPGNCSGGAVRWTTTATMTVDGFGIPLVIRSRRRSRPPESGEDRLTIAGDENG